MLLRLELRRETAKGGDGGFVRCTSVSKSVLARREPGPAVNPADVNACQSAGVSGAALVVAAVTFDVVRVMDVEAAGVKAEDGPVPFVRESVGESSC